jgi:integrase
MGSIYRPKYRGKNGKAVESRVWWIKYYRAGKPFRESSKSTRKGDAERILKLREGQIVKGEFAGLRVERITFDELAEDFLMDYRVNGKKSLTRAQRSVKHLKDAFEGMRAQDMTTDRVRRYISLRQDEGAVNGTINRELAALKRMFNLARQMTPPKVINMPYIPHLREDCIREGCFEHGEYLALKEALPPYLKPIITMAYHTGMRQAEILGLRWSQVDLIEGKIILRAQDTKNRESRVLFMEGELLEAIRFQRTLSDSKGKSPWVFFNGKEERIGRFDKAWKTACKKAWEKSEGKVPLWDPETKKSTRIFHDFRRTAVRNLVRAGVPERVAMMISGHKTRSVFERYNIVNEDDLKRASRKVTEYHQDKGVDRKMIRAVEIEKTTTDEETKQLIH